MPQQFKAKGICILADVLNAERHKPSEISNDHLLLWFAHPLEYKSLNYQLLQKYQVIFIFKLRWNAQVILHGQPTKTVFSAPQFCRDIDHNSLWQQHNKTVLELNEGELWDEIKLAWNAKKIK